MSYKPNQPEYYGWYPNTTVSAAFAQGVWDAIMDNQTSIEFDNTQTYTIDCGSDTDSIIVNGLFIIDKPLFQVRGNGSSLVFYFSSLSSSLTAVDGAPLFKWSLPIGVTEMAVGFQNITLQLSPNSIQYIDETFNRYGALTFLETWGTDNTFNNVQFLDLPTVGIEIGARINGLQVARSVYRNCYFRYGGSNHNNCLYVQGQTRFERCVFEVKRKYSSHAIYWGLDRNNVVIKNCKFYYIGGYYPDYVYAEGEARTGTVLSWRGTEGSGVDARGLKFIKNYMEGCWRTLIGFDSGPYSNTIHRDAFVSENIWYNCGPVQFDNQHNGVFTKNKLYGTYLSIDNCYQSKIYDNPQLGNIVWLENTEVDFYNNVIDDEGFSYSHYFLPSDNTKLSIINNTFRFKFRAGDPWGAITWQWQNNSEVNFSNNRIEVWNSPTSMASLAWRSSYMDNKFNDNVLINCYLIFRTPDLTYSGINEFKNNTLVNNAMASSTRVLENTASGPFIASGNEVVNGTYQGTLNNA